MRVRPGQLDAAENKIRCGFEGCTAYLYISLGSSARQIHDRTRAQLAKKRWKYSRKHTGANRQIGWVCPKHARQLKGRDR